MWLLDVDEWRLQEFDDEDTRENYAILSHKWEDKEVLFAEIDLLRQETENGGSSFRTYKQKGIRKLIHAREEAKKHNLKWIWCDQCCINSSNSTELGESINSMYRWYEEARICIAYISDRSAKAFLAGGEKPIWFTRGWTLQELIAPRKLCFYDQDWQRIGEKDEAAISRVVNQHTGIDKDILSHAVDPLSMSVATRMSWAADRRVKKKEDMAYSLLGLFGVNMPLIYGEGQAKAFVRLQQQIILDSLDHSIFAWKTPVADPRSMSNLFPDSSLAHLPSRDSLPPFHGLLADHPSAFKETAQAVGNSKWMDADEFQTSNRGLGIHFQLQPTSVGVNLFIALLNCKPSKDSSSVYAIYLQKLGYKTQQYARVHHDELIKVHQPNASQYSSYKDTMVYIRQTVSGLGHWSVEYQFLVLKDFNCNCNYTLLRQMHRPLSDAVRQYQPAPQQRNIAWLTSMKDNGFLLDASPGKVIASLVFGLHGKEQNKVTITFVTTDDLQVGYLVFDYEYVDVAEIESRLYGGQLQLSLTGEGRGFGNNLFAVVHIARIIDFPRCLYIADVSIDSEWTANQVTRTHARQWI